MIRSTYPYSAVRDGLRLQLRRIARVTRGTIPDRELVRKCSPVLTPALRGICRKVLSGKPAISSNGKKIPLQHLHTVLTATDPI